MGARRSPAPIVAFLLLLVAVLLPPPAGADSKDVFRKDISVTTRDGVVLPAAYFRAQSISGSLPVVVLPHGGGDRGECEWYVEKAKRYATNGYVAIIYTARGHGRFPGLIPRPCPMDARQTADPNDMFDAFGPKTLADLYDVVNAVVRDEDSHADRKTVGIHGYSQGGATTNLGGAWEQKTIEDLRPGSSPVEINPYGIDIDAIGPGHTFYGLYRSLAPNECVKESFGLALLAGYYGSGAVVDPYLTSRWTSALASGEQALKDGIKPEMKLRSPETYARDLAALPSFWVQAFDDLLFPADEAVKAFHDGALDRMWLSWGGHAAPASNAAEREIAAREASFELWFDRFLKGGSNGLERGPRVTFWFHDPDKPKLQHRLTASTWPPPDAKDVLLYLAPDERLASSEARSGEAVLANAPGMQSLAADPIVSSLPLGSSLPAGARTPLETAVFSSKPFREATLLAGAPSLRLFWMSTGREFQTNALLWDVYPDGTRWLISRGCALHKSSPGEEVSINLNLFHSTRLLAPGHKLELWVSPVDQPSFLASKEASENWLYFGKKTPSRLEVPLMRFRI
jgi:predicted acyl esterase